MTGIKGYKATLWSGMSKYGRRRTPYEAGGVYSVRADIVLCLSGLHFCRQLCDVYATYDSAFYTRVFEVEARGGLCSGGYKMCTDRLKFVRELTPAEVLVRLAIDANDMYTAEFASHRVKNILHSVIMPRCGIWDPDTDIVSIRPEWDHMPDLYRAKRRLQWAQAFNDRRELPICRVAMYDCKITKPGLAKLVETLQLDPILQSDNDKEEKKQ